MAQPPEEPPTSPSASTEVFGVKLTRVRICGFKSLVDVEVPISDRVTVLIGENNSGKTSFLEALAVAFGNRRPTIDDLHVDANGVRAEIATIALRFEPSGAEFSGTFADVFGNAVLLPPGPGFVVLRAVVTNVGEDKEPEANRSFLKKWPSPAEPPHEVESASIGFGNELRKYFQFDYVDARRDILDELRNKRSYWGRLLADVSVPDAEKTRLGAELKALGDELKTGSPVLTRLTDDLASMSQALGAQGTTIELDPLPRKVDDLVRSIDVVISSPGSSSFPVAGQGMGTRSLGAIFAFRAFVNNKRSKSEPESTLSLATFEEPESHLHPHAQRQVFRVLSDISGQTIISTHSVHVASVADLPDFRVFRRRGAGSTVKWVSDEDLGELGKLEMVKRKLLSENPETLFSRVVGIVEGETESEALPILGRHTWPPYGPDGLGISISLLAGVGSADTVAAILEKLGIPWVCLVDNDEAGMKALARVSKAIGRTFTEKSDEIVTFSEGRWEEHVLQSIGFEELTKVLETWFVSQEAKPPNPRNPKTPFERRKQAKHGTPLSDDPNGPVRDYSGPEGHKRFVRDELNAGKAKLAIVLAEHLCASQEGTTGLPGVDAFFARLEALATGGKP